MSAAQQLNTLQKVWPARVAEFSASIDKGEPLNFKATFEQVDYPQVGEPPRWTIKATYRNPEDNHIQTIRVIFLKDPVDAKPERANADVMVLYSNTAEDPPSEYSTTEATTALTFNPENSSIIGSISATVSDDLDPPASHELDINCNLQALQWSKRM